MSDRFIVDEDYNWVDTLTDECFDDKRYYCESRGKYNYIFDRKDDEICLSIISNQKAVLITEMLNMQNDTITELLEFIKSRGLTNEDFKKFIEEMNEMKEEKPIDFNSYGELFDSESIDDLILKYIRNKRFYCKYVKGYYYILDRKQDLPLIYVNNITDAIYVVNYLNKQDKIFKTVAKEDNE